jgi:low temperature requirement protein LtrA
MTMAQMVVVAYLAINVKNALTTTGSGFAISYAVLRFILVAEYIRVGRLIPEARPLTHRYSIGFGIAALYGCYRHLYKHHYVLYSGVLLCLWIS